MTPGARPAGLRLARIPRRPVDAERGLDPARAAGRGPAPRAPRARRGHPRGHARSSRPGTRRREWRSGPAERGRHRRPGGPRRSTWWAVNGWRRTGPGIGSACWPGAATWSSPSRSRIASPLWAGPAASSSATPGSRSATSGRPATAGSRSAAGVGAAGFDGPHGRHVHPRSPRGRARGRQLRPPLPDARRRAVRGRWGGPIDITADRFPEIGSTTAAASTTRTASPATGLDRRGWRAGSWPRWSTTRTTRWRASRSSAAASRSCRRSRSASSARVSVREALIRQDDALDAGRRPGPWYLPDGPLPRLLGYRFGH